MGTPEEALAAAQAEEAVLPDHAEEIRDRKTILAGTGEAGSGGDGGPAVDAQVAPFHLAIGPHGAVVFDSAL